MEESPEMGLSREWLGLGRKYKEEMNRKWESVSRHLLLTTLPQPYPTDRALFACTPPTLRDAPLRRAESGRFSTPVISHKEGQQRTAVVSTSCAS